ncbi:MAG TPA: EamA family transporter [Candidatus Limiplasma sp.]|nr:EamA family transporter [Candidatus Limiplasma sp.]HPS80902.1 EamA family transporter [Candidatus Limiplasma sp.]
MWVLFAFGSALFAGLTAILAKIGIRNTDSDVATALRTIVVLLFSWLMAWITGSIGGLGAVDAHTWLFLVLSGLATGGSWLCYFRALQLGDINKVTPIDKSSTVLTMLLAFLLLGEALTPLKGVAMALIGLGAFLMVQRKPAPAAGNAAEAPANGKRPAWLLYALGSAIFASLTSILGKIGIENVNSTLGTAIRTAVVLGLAWAIVFARGKQHAVATLDRRSYLFLALSGIATGGSWLCYYRALQLGPASVVVPIDKLSILVSIAFSRIVFGERLTARAGVGLFLLVAGTLALLL